MLFFKICPYKELWIAWSKILESFVMLISKNFISGSDKWGFYPAFLPELFSSCLSFCLVGLFKPTAIYCPFFVDSSSGSGSDHHGYAHQTRSRLEGQGQKRSLYLPFNLWFFSFFSADTKSPMKEKKTNKYEKFRMFLQKTLQNCMRLSYIIRLLIDNFGR